MVASLTPDYALKLGLLNPDTAQSDGSQPDATAIPTGDANGGDASVAAALATNLFLSPDGGRAMGGDAAPAPENTGAAYSPPDPGATVAGGGSTQETSADAGFFLFSDDAAAAPAESAAVAPTNAAGDSAPATPSAADFAVAAPAGNGDARGSTGSVDGGGFMLVGNGPATNTVGAGGADRAQVLSALDATNLSYVGSGVTVGVLSDSFNELGGAAADEADGNLPPAADIDVLQEDPNGGGTDEGRAMMQIVHDVASGADLDFYTAEGSEAGFAAGILALADSGCKVICDDVSYFNEPFFQTGEVASAIQTVEQEGVTFLTCAGNQASAAYVSAWTPISSTTFDGVTLTDAQNFGSTSDPLAVQAITNGSGFNDPLVVEWNQPYDDATTDIGVIVFQNGSVIGQYSNANIDGFTQFNYGAGTDASVVIAPTIGSGEFQVAIEVLSGPNPGLIEDLLYNDSSPTSVSLSDANAGTVFGHHTSPYAITIGAVDSANTPGNGGTLSSEDFSSSDVNNQLWYNASGDLVANAPIDLNSVAVSGVDDIDTSVFSPFFGTSAATPSVAGVAADMLQANPALTPMEIKQILEETATSFGDPNIAGSGLVNASASIQAALDTVNWVGSSGGWGVAADWSDDAVPGAARDIGISTSGTVTVSHPGPGTAAANTLLVDMNDTLDWINGSLVVGSGALVQGVLELDTSTGQGGASVVVSGLLQDVYSGSLDIGNASLTSSTMVVAVGGFSNEGQVSIIGNTGAVAFLQINGAGADTGPVTIGAHAELIAVSSFLVTEAGSVTVSSGGIADNVIVGGGGRAVVMSGGNIDFAGFGTSGLLTVMSGGTLSGQITFSGTDDELQLYGSSMPTNTISALQVGDTIDLASVAFSSNGTAARIGDNVLQVNEGGNTYMLNLDPTQNLAGSFFDLSADSGSGTLVTVVSGQASPDDFTGDGTSDILWGGSGGAVALWTMSGSAISASQTVTFQGQPDSPGAGWSFAGAGDFGGTGTDDVLWRNTNSTLVEWTMSGSDVTASQQVTLGGNPDFPPSSWSIAGIGDFSGTGTDDILWRSTDGTLAEWTMSGATVVQSQQVTMGGNPDFPPSSWSVGGIGDFTGSGSDDVLWRNTNGQLVLWTMSGATVTSSQLVTHGGQQLNPGSSWSIAGVGDFTGDGVSNVLWRNTDDELAVWTMNGANITASQDVTSGGSTDFLGPSWSVAGIGDYLGNGSSDILWRNTNGQVELWTMNGSVVTSTQALTLNGTPDTPNSTWHVLA